MQKTATAGTAATVPAAVRDIVAAAFAAEIRRCRDTASRLTNLGDVDIADGVARRLADIEGDVLDALAGR